MVIETTPRVTVIENVFIELKDGVKLSARIWLPSEASNTHQVPAVFEFLPYGKRVTTATRDEINYQHFALNGYAGVRVDARGCGDSTGYPIDEYVVQEQDDAIECIEWISKQPWCTGKVGMMGISWGGFNSLQVAARQPEALKAIISVCFTDDRFADDIHFKGGCMVKDKIKWAAYMALMYSLPPDPLISDDWLTKWLDRLDQLPPAAEKWLTNQTRDDYYKQGSVCEDYSKIQTASMLISGYIDGYTNAVKRTYDNIQCPKKGIVGPWVHLYPNMAEPGPTWGYCTEAVNWWNQWLKEIEPTSDDKFIAYVQKNVDVPCSSHVDGKWVENPTTGVSSLYLADGKLGNQRSRSIVRVCSSEGCGQQTIVFWPRSIAEMPREQSSDDNLSYVFDSEPFDTTVDYVGRPNVTLSVASDKPIANIFVRLCVVNANGISRLIGYNGKNLNMSDDYTTVTEVQPGVFSKVNVELDFIGETIQPGDRLRLAVSSAYFSAFISNPEHTTLSLDLSECQLDLPIVLNSNPLSDAIPAVTECKPNPVIVRKRPYYSRTSHTNDSGKTVLRTTIDSGENEILAHGLVTQRITEHVDSVCEDDPNTARLQAKETAYWSRGEDWQVSICYTMDFTMDKEYFKTYETREMTHNGDVIFSKKYSSQVAREGH